MWEETVLLFPEATTAHYTLFYPDWHNKMCKIQKHVAQCNKYDSPLYMITDQDKRQGVSISSFLFREDVVRSRKPYTGWTHLNSGINITRAVNEHKKEGRLDVLKRAGLRCARPSIESQSKTQFAPILHRVESQFAPILHRGISSFRVNHSPSFFAHFLQEQTTLKAIHSILHKHN